MQGADRSKSLQGRTGDNVISELSEEDEDAVEPRRLRHPTNCGPSRSYFMSVPSIAVE